jgi:hypothetical protein
MNDNIIAFPNAQDFDEDEDFDEEMFATSEMAKKYLDIFEKEMRAQKLSEKTIEKHLSNVSFYIDAYLNRDEECGSIREGCYRIDGYLGFFYIEKCMWATSTGMKDSAAGIKKFYKCLRDLDIVEDEDYEYLCNEIKTNMSTWQNTLKRYDEMDEDDDDFWDVF